MRGGGAGELARPAQAKPVVVKPTAKPSVESCCDSPFTVQSTDTCWTYQQCCGGWASITCDQAGQTCTAQNTNLIAGDSCHYNWGLLSAPTSPLLAPLPLSLSLSLAGFVALPLRLLVRAWCREPFGASWLPIAGISRAHPQRHVF